MLLCSKLHATYVIDRRVHTPRKKYNNNTITTFRSNNKETTTKKKRSAIHTNEFELNQNKAKENILRKSQLTFTKLQKKETNFH